MGLFVCLHHSLASKLAVLPRNQTVKVAVLHGFGLTRLLCSHLSGNGHFRSRVVQAGKIRRGA